MLGYYHILNFGVLLPKCHLPPTLVSEWLGILLNYCVLDCTLLLLIYIFLSHNLSLILFSSSSFIEI